MRRRRNTLPLLFAFSVVAQAGCFGKHPGPWSPAPAEDIVMLREHYKIDVGTQEVLRRNVSIWFIGPASGYPEWAVRDADGSINVIAPTTADGRPAK